MAKRKMKPGKPMKKNTAMKAKGKKMMGSKGDNFVKKMEDGDQAV